ncbi:MAG: outer membrane protein assembly factor BamE, partial [Proteobacteria bacterium]|nr:outer membrane protein assembly factor BamE [Pseudomonadota bacterium]
MKACRTSFPRTLSVASLAVFCLIVTGCFSSYRVEIQQGNVISAEQIEKLTPGTPRDEVRFILGTPLIEDPFHAQ